MLRMSAVSHRLSALWRCMADDPRAIEERRGRGRVAVPVSAASTASGGQFAGIRAGLALE